MFFMILTTLFIDANNSEIRLSPFKFLVSLVLVRHTYVPFTPPGTTCAVKTLRIPWFRIS